MIQKTALFAVLLLCSYENVKGSVRFSRQTEDSPCTLQQQGASNVIECSEATLDNISSDFIGDSGGDVAVIRIVSSNVPSIPSSAFEAVPNLRVLTITGSGLSEVTEDSFAGIQNLQRLNLSYNEIDNLDQPLFSLVTDLRRLNLTHNKINSIQPAIFQGLSMLQIVDLSNNELENIPSGLLQPCPNLVYLDLSGNMLKIVQARMFFNMPALTTVDLSRNKITVIPVKLFDNVPNLEKVMLSKNGLRALSSETFAQVQPKLKNLKIDSNNIISINITVLMTKLPGLKKASIIPNPWSCSCFQEVSKWLKTKKVDYNAPGFLDGKRPVCVVMKEIAAQTITDESQTLPDFIGCTKPNEAVATTMRNVYKKQINRYPKIIV